MVDVNDDGIADGYDATFWIPVADTGSYLVEARLVCSDGSVIEEGYDMSMDMIRNGGTTSLFSSRLEIHVVEPGAMFVFGFMPSDERPTSCRPPYHYVVEASRGYWVADPEPSAPDLRRWVSIREQWWSIPSRLRGDERFVFSGFRRWNR